MIKAKLQIKLNRNFYKRVLIFCCIATAGIVSFAYFLGFEINLKSLMCYAMFLIATALFFIALFLIIDKFNKRYIVFDGEKIIEKRNNEEKVILYYNQILSEKYYNKIKLNIDGTGDFGGYVKILFKNDTKDKEAKYLCVYLSKKEYNKIFK